MFSWYTLINLGYFMGLFGHLDLYFPVVNFPALKGHQQSGHKKRVKKHDSFTLLLLGYGVIPVRRLYRGNFYTFCRFRRGKDHCARS